MARNYISRTLYKSDSRFDDVVDILSSDMSTIAKANALGELDLTNVTMEDALLVAFAAGRNFESAVIEKAIGSLF